jgi:hypothetical protein
MQDQQQWENSNIILASSAKPKEKENTKKDYELTWS